MLNMKELAEIEAWNAGSNYDGRPTEIKRDIAALVETVKKLHHGLCFAQSVIKCGEPWTATCEQDIGAVLAAMRGAAVTGDEIFDQACRDARRERYATPEAFGPTPDDYRKLMRLRIAVRAFLDSCPDGIERYNPKMADLIAAMNEGAEKAAPGPKTPAVRPPKMMG